MPHPFIIEKHIKSITTDYLFRIDLASLTSGVSRQDDSSSALPKSGKTNRQWLVQSIRLGDAFVIDPNVELALITRPVIVPVLLPNDVDVVSVIPQIAEIEVLPLIAR